MFSALRNANTKRPRDDADDVPPLQRRREKAVGRALRGMIDRLNSAGIVDEWDDELARVERTLIESMNIVQIEPVADPVGGDVCSLMVRWEEPDDYDEYFELEFELVYDEEDGWAVDESGWVQ